MNKTVKIIIIALAPIALVFGLWMAMSGGGARDVVIPGAQYYADLETGDVFTVERGQVKTIPMKSKSSGKFVIYPIEKNAAGQWVVVDQYRVGIPELAEGTPLKLNLDTYVIESK